MRRTLRSVVLAAAVVPVSGCSLFIIAGQILNDGRVPAAFERTAGIDLTAGDREVVVVTSIGVITPDDATFEVDLRDAVLRKLRRSGIEIGNDSVVDDLALGRFGEEIDTREIFDAGEADVVIDVRLETVGLREENSPDLFQGKLSGRVKAYGRDEGLLFEAPLNASYPNSRPQPVTASTERALRTRFLEIASRQIAELFYEHKVDFEVF
ncbi:MAG: hypothetical protein AAGJ97_00055 [Planctomycetota bacterium]